jgi:hypothetical protein
MAHTIDGRTVTQPDAQVETVDLLLAEVINPELPLAWRAACFVDLSDHLEAERAKGRRVFRVGGQLTLAPELLALDVIGLPRPACARGAVRAAARRAAGN